MAGTSRRGYPFYQQLLYPKKTSFGIPDLFQPHGPSFVELISHPLAHRISRLALLPSHSSFLDAYPAVRCTVPIYRDPLGAEEETDLAFYSQVALDQMMKWDQQRPSSERSKVTCRVAGTNLGQT